MDIEAGATTRRARASRALLQARSYRSRGLVFPRRDRRTTRRPGRCARAITRAHHHRQLRRARRCCGVRLYEELGRGVEAEVALDDFLNENPASTVELAPSGAPQLLLEQSGDAGLLAACSRQPARSIPMPMRSILIAGDAAGTHGPRRRLAVRARCARLLARRPDDPTVQNALGYVLVDRTAEPGRGPRADRAAHGADARQRAGLDSMGWALVQGGGSRRRGSAALERASASAPTMPRSRAPRHGAVALGRRDEAHALWKPRRSRIIPSNRHLLAAIEAHPRP